MWPAQPEFREPIPEYQEGGSLRLTAALADYGGGVTPAAVRLLLLPPGATQSTTQPVEREGDSVTAVVALQTPGLWRYRFESVAAPYGAYESAFYVLPRRVPAPE